MTLVLTTFGVAVSGHARADELVRTAKLYKNPQCTCCDAYADYLRTDGFEVTVTPTHDLSLIEAEHNVQRRCTARAIDVAVCLGA